MSQQPDPARSSRNAIPLPKHIFVFIILFLLLILGLSGGAAYFSVTNWIAANTSPTPTPTPVPFTPTATPNGPTATALRATAAVATATTSAVDATSVAATATAVPNPYPPHSGTLALDDTLQDNTQGNQWNSQISINGGACSFPGDGYHVIPPPSTAMPAPFVCNAEGAEYQDFTYQVQMTIIRGSRGGIFFRQVGMQGPYYYFAVGIDGSYAIERYDGKALTIIRQGNSQIIRTGLNQPNKLAVVAQGSSITVYINGQPINQITDHTSSNGLIGVAVDSAPEQAEAVFNDVQIWML